MHNRLGGLGSSPQGLTTDFNNPAAFAMLQAQQQALDLSVQKFFLY
jgi:hypothetical protein